MKKTIRRWVEIIGGTFLILLGIVGLVLPFLQGILFIVLGVTLISPAHGKRLLAYVKKKWHDFREKIKK
ncbi:hypothetical protein IPN35_06140 [Candidatus Peregrinibacteria bacterium]|nr:MAG: hypothetical protein IPN35_06140 [Candidatus Peregrinibacteria bacterium]